MKERTGFIYRLFNLSLVFTILCGHFSVFAQVKTGGKTPAASQTKTAGQKCSGAWTGSVIYTRYQKMTDKKTTPRVSGRGEDTRDFEMTYDYKATIAVLEAPEKNGTSIGKATITHKFRSKKIRATAAKPGRI
jgi:hypothetical protein